MAEIVLTNCYVSIAANVLSAHFTSVAIEGTAVAVPKTHFGDTWEGREPGLKDWTASLDFNQDYAAGQLDSIMWPLLGTRVAVEFRSDAGARAPANPSWVGSAIMTSYPPVSGGVGELATGTVALEGDGELQRLTA